MSRYKYILIYFSLKKGDFVSYDNNNNKGRIIGCGTIGKFPNSTIDDVILVDVLKHNLIRISQLCDRDNNVTFDLSRCGIVKCETNQTLFIILISENAYTNNFNKVHSNYVCILSNEDEP